MGRWLEDAETSARAQSNARRLFNSFCAWLDLRDELPGGEVVEGAEATGQLVITQAPLAVEPAQKLLGRALPFLRVALQTAGHQVAIGIAAEVCLRNDVVEAPPVMGDA